MTGELGDLISPEETTAIQEQLGRLALAASEIDLEGFLELCEQVGSPQALASGLNPRAVSSAGDWAEQARLLKPFWEDARSRVQAIREGASDRPGKPQKPEPTEGNDDAS
ncbi:MAG: hypothetical protein GEU75_06945 [Dehalococcoidia bacterium]|nr:hypothetical protein [Dehalococcoidia bacterium]